MRIDRFAVWFYTLCVVLFALLAIGQFHGSSISIHGSRVRLSDSTHQPLLGKARAVRVDEWGYHTPAILNQVFREPRFATADSVAGPGNATLLYNLPCRHFTQLFRPQFWSFHILPVEIAFAFYWQMKGLFLLTGVFTFLLLLTGSSRLSALGSLWFFFSSHTQWTYSWPSLLPEMIGTCCWVTVLACYLLTGRRLTWLAVASILSAAGMINFALCAYPPHQIPLIVISISVIVWWVIVRWPRILDHRARMLRIFAVAGSGLLTAVVLLFFYLDAREVLVSAAQTVYPGHRVSNGGGVPLTWLMSHFFDLWKTELHFPPVMGNICEASGYLWLAPVTLLTLGPARGPVAFQLTVARVCCWGAFILIAAWMLLPIPGTAGKWIFFDKVTVNRCYPALGLVNITIVILALATAGTAGSSGFDRKRLAFHGRTYLGFFLLATILLVLTNTAFQSYFRMVIVLEAAAYTALLVFCIAHRWRRTLAVAILLPLFAHNALVNPVDRGLDTVLQSSLFKAGRNDPNLRGKWLIYSQWIEQAGFLTAAGFDTMNSMRIVPDLERLTLADPEGRFRAVYNQSSYLIGQPLPEGERSQFASPSLGIVVWKVSPFDPVLKEMGIRYLAFDREPGMELTSKLQPLPGVRSPGLWLYRAP